MFPDVTESEIISTEKFIKRGELGRARSRGKPFEKKLTRAAG